MLSLKKCREILGEKAKHLTDEQLDSVRKALIRLAEINVKMINENKSKKDEERMECRKPKLEES